MSDLIYSKNKVPKSLIDECERLHEETGETYFILESSIISKITLNGAELMSEKRDAKIDSLLDEYCVGNWDKFKGMPSQYSYYDTETKLTDIYKRYDLVVKYIKDIGFKPSKWNLGREYEQSYILSCEDTENDLKLQWVIRLKPNMVVSLFFNETGTSTLYYGFFNKYKILNSILETAGDSSVGKSISRDIKISDILQQKN